VLIVTRISCVILSALKTSISLPGHLFRRAEAAARKLKMSRSQLYATALAGTWSAARPAKLPNV